MRGQEFRARDKKVNKLGRDGLVEQNKATGEERRVSQRTADISFGPERTPTQQLGRQTAKRPHKKRHARPEAQVSQQAGEYEDFLSQTDNGLDSLAQSEMEAGGLAEPETAKPDAPPVIRDTRDMPASAPHQGGKRRKRHRNRLQGNAKDSPGTVRRAPSDTPVPKRWQEPRGGAAPDSKTADKFETSRRGPLQFEENAALDRGRNFNAKVSKKRQKRPSASAAAEVTPVEAPQQSNLDEAAVPEIGPRKEGLPLEEIRAEDSGQLPEAKPPPQSGRLRFEDAPAPVSGGPTPSCTRLKQDENHLRFEHSDQPPQTPQPVQQSTQERPDQQRQAGQPQPQDPVSQALPSAPQPEQPQEHPQQQRLRFEDENKSTPGTGDQRTADAPTRHQQKQYQRAERRVEQASRKLEKAQSKIPTKRRARLAAQYDSDTGKVRHRLQFEKEAVPEGAKPSLPKQAAGAVVRTAGTAAALKAHQKMREVERENVGVESAHKTEFAAEQGAGRFLRWNKKRLRSKPYRAVRQAERRLVTEQTRLAWQTALRDNPALRRKNVLSKWYQKRKIKRKYAQAAREAKRSIQQTQNILSSTGKIAHAAAQFAASHKAALALVALLVLIMVMFSAGTSSCGAMLAGVQSGYLSATYMSNENDICNADLRYTELETELQMDINATETNYPGYDSYTYNIGEISHDPFELMAYLSTAYDAFTYENIKVEIEALFNRQYTLTRTPATETRYTEDGTPYTYSVLKTTLTVRPLSEVIAESLNSEQADRYNVYMQTLGNRQAFGNPFGFAWLGNVSSTYGWRVHPITKVKDLHRGLDIAVAQGTEIHAVQDGKVVSAGDAGGYGLCVVIQDEKGYQSRYAHCSSLSVSAGQEVKRGDVIAAVGSTGNSTGPHLHLEVMVNGEYLNPIFFVETGGVSAAPGSPGGAELPDYPGAPVTDETYAAMLAEAQKYLGYPYVWGGSSPSTSFDCSGFVSWVINHSGWNVGRRGAQGLYNLCTPVSAAEAKPGDLIFFTKTYSAPNPVSHVGIYVGNSQMIHCGDPISYANINSRYWREHFYAFARLPRS